MSLLTSRASHLSAGIASHALLTIMFKDVPLLFLVDPILQNTDKQSQLFGQAPGKSHSDPLKTNFFNKKYCHKQHTNLQQNKFQILSWWYFTLFCKSYQHHQEWHGYEVKNLSNKHMFRYTSGISPILLNSHLKFLPIQSNSNVVQTNNQNVGEAQI